VVAGERADTMVGEELGFVENVGELSHEAVLRHQLDEVGALYSRISAVGNRKITSEMGFVLEEPVHPLAKSWQALNLLFDRDFP